eukprot:TRINITY_DN7769_c0_g1_i1.p2 TRINITY_DN7769_c0_g1~~TRINITY_DN7769_c0_g1_i1.p2  ORF type:complete len:285 (-),score=48.88 TRINITY_DN7769_c0_g1_i1:73-927(-)
MIRNQVMRILRRSLRVEELLDWTSFEKKYVALQKEIKGMMPLPEHNAEKELAELKESSEILKGMIANVMDYANKALDENKRVLLEDNGGEMLGMNNEVYTHTTGELPGIARATIAFGIAPSRVDTRIGVVKAYCTRTDQGPVPTLIQEPTSSHFITKGNELCSSERRRCGWLDLNMLKLANMLNGYTSLMLTKLDVLDHMPEISIALGYRAGKQIFEDRIPQASEEAVHLYKIMPGWPKDTSEIKRFKELPKQAKNFVRLIEDTVGVPVSWITVGKMRDQIIRR